MTLALVLFLVGISIEAGTVVFIALKMKGLLAEFFRSGKQDEMPSFGDVFRKSLGALAMSAFGALLSLSGVAVFIYRIGKHILG